MQFHVAITIHDALVLDQDRRLRQVLGPQIGKVLASGKVQGGSFLAGVRGGFFLLEVDSPDELYTLLGPEIYSTCRVEAHPTIPFERGAAIFQQWEAEGR